MDLTGSEYLAAHEPATEAEYNALASRMSQLMDGDAQGAEWASDSPEGQELRAAGVSMHKYERRHFPEWFT